MANGQPQFLTTKSGKRFRILGPADQGQPTPQPTPQLQPTLQPQPAPVEEKDKFLTLKSGKRFRILGPAEEAPRRQIREPRSIIENIKQTGSDLVSQFVQGAETTERGIDVLVGQPSGERRTPLTEPKSIVQAGAKLAGEFIAPIPQTLGLPIGFFAKEALSGVTTISKGVKSLNVARKAFTKLATGASEAAKNAISEAVSLTSNVSNESAKRLLEKGGKILKTEFFQKGAISKSNREKASKGFPTAFKEIGKKFDERIAPILKESKEKLDIGPALKEFTDEIVDLDLVKRNKKGKLISGLADTEGKLSKAFNNIETAISDAQKNPTLKTFHLLRKRLDNIKFGSGIKDNLAASQAVSKLRKNLVDFFPESYKQINDEFAKIFELRDQFKLGGALSTNRVESTLLGLRGRGKSQLREFVGLLDEKLPSGQKFLENTLDELAAKEFSEFKPQDLRIALAAGAAAISGRPGTALAIGATTIPALQAGGLLAARGAGRVLGAAPKALRQGAVLGGREVIRGLGVTPEERRRTRF